MHFHTSKHHRGDYRPSSVTSSITSVDELKPPSQKKDHHHHLHLPHLSHLPHHLPHIHLFCNHKSKHPSSPHNIDVDESIRSSETPQIGIDFTDDRLSFSKLDTTDPKNTNYEQALSLGVSKVLLIEGDTADKSATSNDLQSHVSPTPFPHIYDNASNTTANPEHDDDGQRQEGSASHPPTSVAGTETTADSNLITTPTAPHYDYHDQHSSVHHSGRLRRAVSFVGRYIHKTHHADDESSNDGHHHHHHHFNSHVDDDGKSSTHDSNSHKSQHHHHPNFLNFLYHHHHHKDDTTDPEHRHHFFHNPHFFHTPHFFHHHHHHHTTPGSSANTNSVTSSTGNNVYEYPAASLSTSTLTSLSPMTNPMDLASYKAFSSSTSSDPVSTTRESSPRQLFGDPLPMNTLDYDEDVV